MKLRQEHEQSSLGNPQRLAPRTWDEKLSFYDVKLLYKTINKQTRNIDQVYTLTYEQHPSHMPFGTHFGPG